jgi:hypothetical protein
MNPIGINKMSRRRNRISSHGVRFCMNTGNGDTSVDTLMAKATALSAGNSYLHRELTCFRWCTSELYRGDAIPLSCQVLRVPDPVTQSSQSLSKSLNDSFLILSDAAADSVGLFVFGGGVRLSLMEPPDSEGRIRTVLDGCDDPQLNIFPSDDL